MNTDFIELLSQCINYKRPNLLKFLYIIYKYKYNKTLPKIELELKSNKKNNKIKILLCCNWCSSIDLINLWNKMMSNNNDIEFVSTEPCDYYCVINRPSNDINIDKSRTIYFQMEPHMYNHPEKWGEWANPENLGLFFCGTHKNTLNMIEWHISKTYNELENYQIIKNEEYNNVFSTVLSSKYVDIGQQKRIDFIKYIDNNNSIVHVYGSNNFLWKNYKGNLEYHKKDNGLFPYKYTFNCENNSIKNYCTEKLYDGILAECLVFYSGCYNIKDYLPENSFVYLELSNFEEDLKIIQTAIKEDWHTLYLPNIRAAKKKILNELTINNKLKNIIDNKNKKRK